MSTSPNERDADRIADQLGQDAARADYAEQEFIDHREELAEQLLAGLELYVCGKPLLAFDDLEERVYSDFSELMTQAFKHESQRAVLQEAVDGAYRALSLANKEMES